MLAPTGTPPEIIARLNAETAKVLTLPDVKSRLDSTGMEAHSSSPEELGKLIRSEISKWAKVVQSLGLTAD
jgi:tripartite-type tricarboxylate transporter receptor subunit TctC